MSRRLFGRVRLPGFAATLIAAVLFGAVEARATLVTAEFTATVTSLTDTLGIFPGVAAGSSISGSFSYSNDPADYDSAVTQGSSRIDYSDAFPDNGVFDFSISFGGVTRTASDLLPSAIDSGSPSQLGVLLGSRFSNLQFLQYSHRVLEPLFVESFTATLTDSTGTAFSSLLPPESYELDDFDANQVTGSYQLTERLNPPRLTSLNLRFTSLSATSIPEPSALGLIGTVAAVWCAGRGRRR